MEQRRYLTERELMDKAVERALDRAANILGKERVGYASVQDFYHANPTCCRFVQKDELLPSGWQRWLGFYALKADVDIDTTDGKTRPPFQYVSVYMDSCGRTGPVFGPS